MCVCVHRCSLAGVTWTSICWLTVIRSTPARSAPESFSAWTSFEITFTSTSRWDGAEGRTNQTFLCYGLISVFFSCQCRCVIVKRWGTGRGITEILTYIWRDLKSMLLVPKVQSITAFFLVKILSTYCVCTCACSKSRLIRKSFQECGISKK